MTSELGHRPFAEMVQPYLDDAYGLARWLSGNWTDAEDVVQDACTKALAAIDSSVIERPRAWVLTIVRNTAFTWLVKNRPKAVLPTDDAQLLETAGAKRTGDTAANPEESPIAAANEAAVEAAIQALPHLYREVVVMRDIQGLSYREISAAISEARFWDDGQLARGACPEPSCPGLVRPSDDGIDLIETNQTK
jgi:RNA polymerase sigma factor (sigma-70 family)